MKKILIIGAGKSATSAIEYLLDNAAKHKWAVILGDYSENLAESKIKNHPFGKAIFFDVNDEGLRQSVIQEVDIVVSMLPAHMHVLVARDCLELHKHLVTASYVSDEMLELNEEAKQKDLVFMFESGLDPGIDHMSAMQKIDEIKAMGGKLKSFKSYTGGLIAKESDDNPWHYKFTWNPRNVILAGQGTAQYIEDGKYKYIPYNRLFAETETITIPGIGKMEAYANRDSLSYIEKYKLQDVDTVLRATLRWPNYCEAWSCFVQLGWTDDSYTLHNLNGITYADLLVSFLPNNLKGNIKKQLAGFLKISLTSTTMKQLEWLGLFLNKKISLKEASPAQVLQDLLEEKWALKKKDKDLIAMIHEFKYVLEGKSKTLISYMSVIGTDNVHTAMAKTVGLPLAIIVKMILLDKIKQKGVQIPLKKNIYNPVLKELESLGVVFKEKELV